MKGTDDIVNFLFNSTNRNNLLTPTVHWHKDLTGNAEDNLMETLEKLTEHQVPIPIKMWLAAAGLDKETLVRDAREDESLRKQLGMLRPSTEDSGSDVEVGASLTSRSVNSPYGRGWRSSLLGRDFSDMTLAKSGKKKKYVHNARVKAVDTNWQIAKIAATAGADQNYRIKLMKANQAKGISTLKGLL